MAAVPKEPANLAKAMSHPLRIKILTVMETPMFDAEHPAAPATVRPVSPNELSNMLEEPLGNVSYHVKCLLEYGCVKLVGTKPRRGAVEHFYRSTNLVVVDGVTITPAQAKLAAEAITEALIETEDDEMGEQDAAGRTMEERKELFELRDQLVAA